MRIDAEVDYHGFTRDEMVRDLDRTLDAGRWAGLQRVRVIHGTGMVLGHAARDWADRRGMPWAPEPGNPGTIILHPSSRHNNASRHAAPAHRPRRLPRPHTHTPSAHSAPFAAQDRVPPRSSPSDIDAMAREFEALGAAPQHEIQKRKRAG